MYQPETFVLLDIETTLDHKTIHGYGLTYCELGKPTQSKWGTTREELEADLQGATHIVGHNLIGFDLPVLDDVWGWAPADGTTVVDTLLLSRLANPSRTGGHSLKNLATLAGGELKDDFDPADFDGPITQKMIDYCLQDTRANVDVAFMLYHELAGFDEWAVENEHIVARETRIQEDNGFKLNFTRACDMYNQHEQRMQEIERELQDTFPPIVEERYSEKTGKRLKDKVTVFNPGSRQQVAERLEAKGAVWKKRTETGKAKVDETTLAELEIPEAVLVLEYLTLGKRIGMLRSWLDAVGEDGRIHGRVNTCGAVTGRMTHSKPNMAQIPSDREYRECFTVEEGNKLVGIDASGLELRMLAHYMQDAEYTDLILNGDIHTYNQEAAGLPTRNDAKTFIYAFLYGAGDAKIGSIVGGGQAQGAKLKAQFLHSLPALDRLLTKVVRIAGGGQLPGLDGRRVHVRSEHSALNTLLQSAGAIVMKEALVIATEKLKEYDYPYKLVAQVHDEFQVEVPEAYADRVGVVFRNAIRQSGRQLELRCPLDGEYQVGDTWADTH
jgi:DNA polymerase I-like protein with 3'-5' exonuclease and polymerase domains